MIDLNPIPSRINRPDTLDDDSETFYPKLTQFGQELVAIGAHVDAVREDVDDIRDNIATLADSSAQSAASAAGSAQAAAAAVDAEPWVSGATYQQFDRAVSRVNFRAYRKITTSAGGTVDPANDPTNWQPVAVAGPKVRSARSANVQIVPADLGVSIEITSGTFAQTIASAAALGPGWWCELRNTGTGIVTLTPWGSDLVDGAASARIGAGWHGEIRSDGATLRLVAIKQSTGYMKVSDRKANNVGGGALTTNPQTVTRTLNTVDANTIAGASLAGNAITLPPGRYRVSARVPAAAASHQAYFASLIGSQVSGIGNSPIDQNSHISGIIDVSATQAFSVTQLVSSPSQYLSDTTLGRSAINAGVATTTSIYTEVEIEKIA